jgi:hypothetical protein
MSSRALECEKWRPTVDLARRTPRAAAGRHERKALHKRDLQPITAASAHGEMALWALEKAPFSATFSSIFPVFFWRACPEWRFGRGLGLEMR